MIYTNIVHSIRHVLGITANEYFICDLVYHSQHNPYFSDSGWCVQSYSTIAGLLFISVKGCKKSCDKLATIGLLELQGKKKRVTDKWLSSFDLGYSVPQNEGGNKKVDGERSTPRSGNGVHQPWGTEFTENGVLGSPHNKKSKFKLNPNYYYSNNEEEEGGDKNIFSFKKRITNSGVDDTGKKYASPKKKVPPKKKGVNSVPLFSFDDTALADPDYFVAKFSNTDYQFADLEYYRSRLRTWGNDNGVKLSEAKWLETAKMFMRRDTEKGNLIRKPELNQYNNARSKQIINPEQAFRILNSRQDW